MEDFVNLRACEMVIVKRVLGLSVMSAVLASLVWPPRLDSSLGQDKPKELSCTLNARADRLIADRETIGSDLVAILADEQAQVLSRLQAADRLGKLQYLPAIPALVRYIDLTPRHFEVGPPPAARALAIYGDAAMPALVQEYLKVGITYTFTGFRRQHAILYAIGEGKTAETAQTYARGIAAKGDAAMRERVEWFLEELEAREENRRPKHGILKYNEVGKK